MIDNNENESGWSHRYKLNRTRPEHGYRYTKYKMCLNALIVICAYTEVRNVIQTEILHLITICKYLYIKLNNWIHKCN